MSYTESFQYDTFAVSETKPDLDLFDLDLNDGKFSSPSVGSNFARYKNLKAGKVNGMYIAYTSDTQTMSTDLAMQDPSDDMVGTRAGVTLEAIGTQNKEGDTDYAVDAPFKWDLKLRVVDRVIDSMTDAQLEAQFRVLVSALYDSEGNFIMRDLINGSLTPRTSI